MQQSCTSIKSRDQQPLHISFCAFFGLQVLIRLIKVKKLDQKERMISSTA
ncbi:hypothetical protein BDA96_05G141900 [Sorghum bicolor]|uniref:Uncharacterized protein n=2 Tax=Sorghum bicolor TaxID=4558 RepID=A0A1Z5RIB1_SORBI|nr:hypothetical protein BDA96_05G141900 [Sorghum bicolor]OQU83510.1 hypothetical protein SORBI_3005G129501 [Sorghum bicolor]